ncbi:MAG TPA: thioester domain-containing protein, partial [Mycobacteriales bacterium]|nr:thioester domain-containing protein [Mycobacteriales bacterium]
MFGGHHPRTTRRALRAGIAALGTGMILAAYTGVAAADDSTSSGTPQADAVTGVPSAHSVGTIFDDNNKPVFVSKFDLVLSTNQTTVTYCIDLHHELANGKTYVEGNWDKANPGSDMPHILWALDHSGPLLPAADVLAAAGAPTSDAVTDRDDDIVYMATQAAVWHFSDQFNLGTGVPTFGGQNKVTATADQAEALQDVYAYLTGSKNTGETEPGPALSVTPDSLSGQVGKAIGPFTVKTTAKTVTLTASSGATVVDGNGKPVDTAANGDTFSVLLDKAGKATVDAKGSGTVPAGRIFVFQASPDTAQKLVVASPS